MEVEKKEGKIENKPYKGDKPVKDDKPSKGDRPARDGKPSKGDRPSKGEKPAKDDYPYEEYDKDTLSKVDMYGPSDWKSSDIRQI